MIHVNIWTASIDFLFCYLFLSVQPLADNLESQTYEIFEKDPVKYTSYQKAVFQALKDRVPDSEKDTKTSWVHNSLHLLRAVKQSGPM